MKDFIAEYCEKNRERINTDMFERKYDRPLVDYVLDTCKNLEVIPAIKLESWEFITDQTKIRTIMNKKLSKDPKIKNNRSLERIAQSGKTLYDLLILNFRVTAKGQEALIQRKLRILKPLKGGYYMRGGKRVMVLNQVVDNSTYVKGDVLNFKSNLYSIKLSTIQSKLHFIDEDAVTCPVFRIDLFMKVTNPLYYFLAEYGLPLTIEMFGLQDIMSVVDDVLDEDNYLYLKLADHLYIEVHAKAFDSHPFIQQFVATLHDALRNDKTTKLKFKNVYKKEYWLERLSEIFSKKRSADKGKRVLMSFEKVMDPHLKRRLMLRKYHRQNTFTIIRWEMTNYFELIKKDSNDLRFKRIRANETLAFFFDNYITKNVYSLLNTDNPPFDKYVRMLNSINEYTLIKATQGGGKSSPTSMFRYERYNDFDAIELSRYTLKGPTGLNGGKKKTSLQYRDIYPSHLGRFDINVTSSSDVGLTGYLCANVKLNDKGYFSDDKNEPDQYDSIIDVVIAKVNHNPDYARQRREYINLQLSRNDEGYINLVRKKSVSEMREEAWKNPRDHGLYYRDGFLHIVPKIAGRNAKGFYTLIKKKQKKRDEVERDLDGYIRLKRVILKIDKQK